MSIRIVLADDHQIMRQGLRSLIEKQADMYVSTLRSYVEAIGGELELTVKLPRRPKLRLYQLGEALDRTPPRSKAGARPSPRRRPLKRVP